MILISMSNTRDAQIWNSIPTAWTPKCSNTEYPNNGLGPAIKNEDIRETESLLETGRLGRLGYRRRPEDA